MQSHVWMYMGAATILSGNEVGSPMGDGYTLHRAALIGNGYTLR